MGPGTIIQNSLWPKKEAGEWRAWEEEKREMSLPRHGRGSKEEERDGRKLTGVGGV